LAFISLFGFNVSAGLSILDFYQANHLQAIQHANHGDAKTFSVILSTVITLQMDLHCNLDIGVEMFCVGGEIECIALDGGKGWDLDCQ
jgi:hypothetical protein